jgi:hypothetical protein
VISETSSSGAESAKIQKQERFKKSRSRSCPSLPKVISVENEDSEGDSDSDQLSRSVSMTSRTLFMNCATDSAVKCTGDWELL